MDMISHFPKEKIKVTSKQTQEKGNFSRKQGKAN